MITRTFRLAVLLLGVFAIAGCGGSDNEEEEWGGDANLVGTWSGTEVGGDATVWTFIFGETTMEAQAGGAELYKGNYTADTAKDPKELSAKVTESSFAEYVGEYTNGIYKIESDLLTFAGNEPGVSARPTSFTPGGGTRVFELTKQ